MTQDCQPSLILMYELQVEKNKVIECSLQNMKAEDVV